MGLHINIACNNVNLSIKAFLKSNYFTFELKVLGWIRMDPYTMFSDKYYEKHMS